MKLTELEKSVIDRMPADGKIWPIRSTLASEAVVVSAASSPAQASLLSFNDGVSLRWGKVGARLNAAKARVRVSCGHR